MESNILPETNMAPENNPLEKEIPNLETIIFRCELLVSGSVFCKKKGPFSFLWLDTPN